MNTEHVVLGRGRGSSFLNVVTWNKVDYDSGKVSNIILDTYIKYNMIYSFKLILMYIVDIQNDLNIYIFYRLNEYL